MKLHHRNLDFSETAEKARIYAATMDNTKSKKSVRFNDVRPPSPSVNYVTPSSSVDLSPLLDQLKQIQGQLSKMKSGQATSRQRQQLSLALRRHSRRHQRRRRGRQVSGLYSLLALAVRRHGASTAFSGRHVSVRRHLNALKLSLHHLR